MSEAHITSIEALETFRNALIIFLEKANRALAEVSDQVARTRTWTQFDQPAYWTAECRRRKRALEQAEAELYSAGLSQLSQNTAQLKIVAARRRTALEEAENKLRLVRKWGNEFDQRVAPLARKIDSLQVIVDQDMPKALVFLDNTTDLLHRYSDSFRPGETPPAPAEGGSAPENDVGESPGKGDTNTGNRDRS